MILVGEMHKFVETISTALTADHSVGVLRAAFRAAEKLVASAPSSRWLIRHFLWRSRTPSSSSIATRSA